MFYSIIKLIYNTKIIEARSGAERDNQFRNISLPCTTTPTYDWRSIALYKPQPVPSLSFPSLHTEPTDPPLRSSGGANNPETNSIIIFLPF